ncbi:hypothetical protein Goshw_005731 [Gossypium schwendimanii]|uniref:Uncharacterized protein n=1 Tax=Gossypium schwendimanii TaxID=34291 RepID=A0A7J9LTS6_GOSSC|nr:hypothetical protein [Gossypium schwendimanii]
MCFDCHRNFNRIKMAQRCL